MQEAIKIEGNLNRPEVNFNAQTGVLSLEGRSIVENAIRFFDPLVEWVKEYVNNPAEKTELHLKMEYFNTSTSKHLLSIIELLEELYNGGDEVEIFWYSSDEDMMELGEDYNAMLDIPFRFLEFTVN